MKTGKLWLAAVLGAMPAIAHAQPSVKIGVGVNVGIDSYDTFAPGDPVESVDVFYDQMSPYGVWVDEPDAGRVFIPDVADYVPYTRGHWEYTNLGFVWVSTEPFGWATSHYGRWAHSRYFGRWYWLPDTQWGPAWVEWRETGTDFGWAPLAPEIVVRAGWQPPIDSWHYCSAEHVLDVNLVRYYEPRARVVEIHREARPLQHYATVSNVKVVVGPPAAQLREHRVMVHPVKVEARTVGRWTPTEARAQVQRAQEHRATFEVQNQRRIETKPQIHTAQVKVIEAHPQIKVKIDERVKSAGRPEAEHVTPGGRAEPGRPAPGQPPAQRNEPGRRPEPEHAQPGQRPGEPQRAEPGRKTEPQRAQPQHPEPQRAEPERKAEPQRAQPQRPEPQRAEPERKAEPQRAQPQRPEPQRSQPQSSEKPRPEPQRSQPQSSEKPRPEPQRSQPQSSEKPRPEPQRAEPQRNQPQPSERPQPTERPRPEPQRSQPPSEMPRNEPQRNQPQPTERPRPEPQRAQPQPSEKPRPEPQRAQPQPSEKPRPEPQRAQPPRPEPQRNEPRGNDRKDDRKDNDRKEPDKR